MYSRDLSQKVKSARKTLYKKGVFCSAFAFYGYMKSPEDKHKLIVDKGAAEIVKRIFDMRLNGFSNHQIAVIFNEEELLTPAQYKKSKDPLCRDWNRYSALQCWTEHIVAHLVKDERYTGKMISGKTETVSVGSSKVRCIKRENQIVVENTHEPIISQEVFDAVNKKKTKQLSGRTETDISLKGLVFCGGCRHKLTYYILADKSIKFYCDYKKYSDRCNCFQGKIIESELTEIIISTVTKELEKAVDTEKAEKQIESISKKNDKVIQKLQLEIISYKQKRLDEYKNFTKGIITEEKFTENRNAINDEILSLEKQIEELKQQSLPQEDLSITRLFKRYIGTDSLNNEAVHDLIKAIYVYPDSRIEILWNFKDTNN